MGQSVCQAPCQGVIICQTVHVVFQCIGPCSGQYAGLAHAAGHLADAVRTDDKLAAAAQQRADRGTQSLTQAD